MRKTISLNYLLNNDACHGGINLYKAEGQPKQVLQILREGIKLTEPDDIEVLAENDTPLSYILWVAIFSMTRKERFQWACALMEIFLNTLDPIRAESRREIWLELKPKIEKLNHRYNKKNRETVRDCHVETGNCQMMQYIKYGLMDPDDDPDFYFRYMIYSAGQQLTREEAPRGRYFMIRKALEGAINMLETT